MKFSALGQKYAEFANVDFSKFNKNMIPIIVENTKNKMKMLITDTEIEKDDILIAMEYKQKVILANFYEEVKNIIGVAIDTNDKKIMGLISKVWGMTNKRDLKINVIGVGNTFNEMYAKFGMPVEVKKEIVDETYNETKVVYGYIDKNKNFYFVNFTHANKKYNGQALINTKPNVITSVQILRIETEED